MRYSSAVLFAAFMICGSMSPVFACRSANNATLVKPSDPRLISTGVDQYNVKLGPDIHTSLRVAIGSSGNSGFCVDLSVLESSDVEKTVTGVMFWNATSEQSNFYLLYIRSDQYQIVHQLFGEVYELVPWTTDASIKKGLHQKNEVDVRVTATGADIQINGTEINNIVARPPTDAENYGVVFWTPMTGTGQFQVGSPRIVK